MIPRNPEQFWIANLKKAASLPARASAAPIADGRHARTSYGPATVAMRGIPSIREESVQRAFINGPPRSVWRARAGHLTRIGMRKVDSTNGRILMSQPSLSESSMEQVSKIAALADNEKSSVARDDVLTVIAISIVAAILCNVLHEGIGHGLIALLTGAKSGVLTTVAWSSAYDSRLVEAGGTLVNLAAGLIFWLFLRKSSRCPISFRYCLLISFAFNLFTGTGYFFFSGVTDFGDWAAVIQGLHPHWAWRTLLAAGGAVSYFIAVRLIGAALVRYVGAPRQQQKRLRRLTLVPYLTAIALASAAAPLNPLGMQLIWQSALPATAGGQSGLIWLQYYIPRGAQPIREAEGLSRRYSWIMASAFLAIAYVAILGGGLTIYS